MRGQGIRSAQAKKHLPVNFSVIIGIYAAACWGNHSCSHCWLSSTTLKIPSALLPVGLQRVVYL
jgi:ubiquitin C-terminal hydrolase